MLVNILDNKSRTKVLVNEFKTLLHQGIDSSKILIILQNGKAKNEFLDEFFKSEDINIITKIQVFSFFGLVYNTVTDNWGVLENKIPSNKPVLLPNNCGLEPSQYILKNIINDLKFEGYNSKHSLLHQLFRRYSLIVQNNLSEEDVQKRSRILKEAFSSDAAKAIKSFCSQTLNYRAFDYLRQIQIFNYIYKNTDYFKNIEYLIVDNADEMPPVFIDFIEHISNQLKYHYIYYDEHGSSRFGYLSADKSAGKRLAQIFNEKAETKGNNHNCDAEIIYNNVVNNDRKLLKNFTIFSLPKRAQMVDFAIKEIKKLLEENYENNKITGCKPSDIAIITPVQDELLKFTLKEAFTTTKCIFLSGSEKLIQNQIIKSCINILKVIEGYNISEFEFRNILSDFLSIPLKYCKELLENFNEKGDIPNLEIPKNNEKYQKFLSLVTELKSRNIPLSEKVYHLFFDLTDYVSPDNIEKINFFIKQLRGFEAVKQQGLKITNIEIIEQIEKSIISENPSFTEIDLDGIVVATPQKLIDFKINTKYQFWLDISSSEWIKSDTGPLYNAWVFQAGWEKDTFTIEDETQLAREKTARVLRKLALLADKHIFAYSSLFDTLGAENFGGIEGYITCDEEKESSSPVFKILPRDDQKPVLEYKEGTMAISAVPGAGKTFILLALIVKLLERKINPENIFVLTYMDSAARNFRERIKNIFPNTGQLPNISTIHGLALRLLKENANYERLGLDAEFDICDDTQRGKIINSISSTKLKLNKTDIEDFTKAVSIMKFQVGNDFDTTNITDKRILKFLDFYKLYQEELKENDLIDYDDILLMSVKLLEENPDILEYYQNICEYVIEDEAQDSSIIQQRLLKLLSGKHGNLIRCGDINQAITTTFSNADVEGFRDFIANAYVKVNMNHSQRCTQGVMDCANNLVEYGKRVLPAAFFDIKMEGVEGKNPISPNPIVKKVFEEKNEEKNYILKTIKNIFAENNNATVGILLRANYQVADWTEFINNAGFKTITRSDKLEQKAVFKVIYAIMKFILTPYDNTVLADTYELLAGYGLYPARAQEEIRTCHVPFISLSPDEVVSPNLGQFHWDMNYWLNCASLEPEEFTIKTGIYYFSSEIERSNVYLISTLVKRISTLNNDWHYVVERLKELSQRNSLSGFRFFSEEDETKDLGGQVQIMTLHKSKGDEFDYVFIPEINEKDFPLKIEELGIKKSTLFTEGVKTLSKISPPKTEQELKEFSLAETFRLIYVAITRAKHKLYLTVSTKVKSFNKIEERRPSILFDI